MFFPSKIIITFYHCSGNFPVKPYKTGSPCSECNREKCTDNLCGKDAIRSGNESYARGKV